MPTVDELIAEGWSVVLDRFTLRRWRVSQLQAVNLSYHVVEGGEVRHDGVVPIQIQIDKPARLRGARAAALLIPPKLAESTHKAGD